MIPYARYTMESAKVRRLNLSIFRVSGLMLCTTTRNPRLRRGLAIPVERDVGIGELGNRLRKKLGAGLDTVRRGVTYELVPLSVTCTKDRGAPKHRVNFGKSPCVDGGKHDLRAREWLDLSKPAMTLGTLQRLIP
jgi:hypothetical protein